MMTRLSDLCIIEKCCSCIELKTGCFIIAYLQLIASIIITVVYALGVVAGIIVINDPNSLDSAVVITILFAVILVSAIMLMAFTIILLIGLHMNRPGFVKWFLVFSLLFIVMYTLSWITGIFVTAPSVTNIVLNVIFTLWDIYFLLVIRSYWLIMGRNIEIHPTA